MDKGCLSTMYKALKIIVTGRVQGVGFRPFVYSLANKYKLTGTVQNNLGCVNIVVEGTGEQLSKMIEDLKVNPPHLSKIKEVTINQIAPSFLKEFTIIPSQRSGEAIPWTPADAAICEDCLKEMKDPQNRRFQYPFINCTQCGPRYTIIKSLPYDRPTTTMAEFMMCEACQKEYDDPFNRRHHAQPLCCFKCGPEVKLLNNKGQLEAKNQQAINKTIELIKQGNIVGMKGIGGYHLACDAYQKSAIDKLRSRKRRPQRPLAIMVKSLEIANGHCHISKKEEEAMTSSEMPIVVLQRKAGSLLPENISPGLSTLGIMFPYTPLHHLLFENNRIECLVMTSANPSGHPILYKDESLEKMREICDYVLTHNREIYLPIDDSVVQCEGDNILYIRRARGFVPEPLKTDSNVAQIIALGGNQKNTISIGMQNHIVMSPHIGDLENEEMIQSFQEQLDHLKSWLKGNETYVAIDKHPLYATTSIADTLQGKMIPIQHHHAHHVSCMEDNGLTDTCFGIILDGTGYGDDGNVWGFEFLYGDAYSYKRLAQLQYTPLPGGEKAVKEPWKNAVGMLLHFWPQEGIELATKLFPEKTYEINIIKQMINNSINTSMAGTCGRLFDAVSAILGICLYSTYEGEAAIKLSDYLNRVQIKSKNNTYPFNIKTNSENILQIDFSPMIYQIIQDKLNNKPIAEIIQTFHQTIINCCVNTVLILGINHPSYNRKVVLSGGSFQNIFLLTEIQRRLQHEGFNVYTHKNVPCNDGGLSLGQLIIASHAVQK